MPTSNGDAENDDKNGKGHPTVTLTDEFASELESKPADERVYRVALQLYEPTRVSAVAKRADCSTDTARRHLKRLADIGVVERTSDSPNTFSRNESYFEWRKRDRLARLPDAELTDRLGALTAREREFRETYDTDDPDAVDALDHTDYDGIEDVWLDLSEWHTVRRRIRRLEAVRKRRRSDSGAARP